MPCENNRIKSCLNIEGMISGTHTAAELCFVNNRMYLFDGSHHNPLYGKPVENGKYIKCEYCESELEDKYINCPNCGAPIKRR